MLGIILFFAVFLWEKLQRYYFIVSVWFPHAAFVHVGCWSFLIIKCPCVSLMCPIRSLLNLTSYCLQLLGALFNVWFDVVLFANTIFPLPLPLQVFSPSDGQVVVCISGCGHSWHIYCLFWCFICFLVSFNS